MQGPSRGALSASRKVLTQALAQAGDRAQVGEQLLAVSGVVGGNVTLRRALADPSREGQDKAAVAAGLFGGKVGEPAQKVLEAAVSQRWAAEVDLSTALESLAVECFLAHAEGFGRLGRVEDELFRFNRIVDGNDELRAALTDKRSSAAARAQVVESLLAGKSAPETVRLAAHAVSAPRGRRFDHAIEDYLQIASKRQEQVTATVTTAVPLAEAQQERLVRSLAEQYGRAVHVNAIVDPDVVGGIRVEIGDEVIDGTVVSRLEEARRRLTS